MDQDYRDQDAHLTDIFVTPLLHSFQAEIEEQKRLLQEGAERLDRYASRIGQLQNENDLLKFFSETTGFKDQLYELLANHFPDKQASKFEQDFEPFVSSSRKHLKTLPDLIRLNQKEERFQIDPNDSSWVKFQKPFKKFGLQTSQIPNTIGNWFRKEKKPPIVWQHNVPVKKLHAYFFVYQLGEQALNAYDELLKQKTAHLSLIKSVDVKVNLQLNRLIQQELSYDEFKVAVAKDCKSDYFLKHQAQLEQWLEATTSTLAASLASIIEAYKTAFDRVDTLELPLSHFSESRLLLRKRNLDERFLRIKNGWKNTYFAQLDDYQVDIELYHIKYVAWQQFYLLKRSCQSRINETIRQKVEKLETTISSAKEKIIAHPNDGHLDELIMAERARLVTQLNSKIVPETMEVIYAQNLPNLLDRLEVKISHRIKLIETSRIIINTNVYDRPLRKHELDHFNPRELVEMDIFNRFVEISSQLKSNLVHKLGSIETFIQDLSSILDYNLKSAESMATEATKLEETKQIATEGIERTTAKIKDIQSELDDLQELLDVELRAAIEEMGKRLEGLTTNENIIELRLILARAKAVERTKNYRKQVVSTIRNFLPIAIQFIKDQYKRATEWLEYGMRTTGLTETSHSLTVELADFLTETGKAIDQLPYVYRRLYTIEALEDDIFFEGREAEMESLKKAYQGWKKGNFAAACICGERGSGSSTLINYFLKDTTENVIKKSLIEARFDKASFLNLFDELLGQKFEDLDAIVDHLKEQGPTIIVLENIQHLYLKKIDGFEAIKILFELISRTSDQIFWLCDITQYAFDYLKKTILIEQYFRFIIPLQKMTDEQIVNIIMKRHRVSGYQLHFEESSISAIQRRKLKRLETRDHQKWLRNDFFTQLNLFAESNISLALLYWLRSTQKVEDNTITIRSLSQTNFAFLKNLANDSVFTLHGLLLHDSLSLAEHAAIFHQSKNLSNRTLMVLEDSGVIVKEDGRYSLNRLLYRQIVNMLQNKNILH